LRGAKSVAEKVKSHVEAVRLSRQLVSLDEHVANAVELEALRRREPDMAKVEALLRELEFVRLLERLKPIAHKPPTFDVDHEGKAVNAPPSAAGSAETATAEAATIEP